MEIIHNNEVHFEIKENTNSVDLNINDSNPVELGLEQVRYVNYNNVNIDNTTNWNKRVSYVPKNGEIVVYSDKDKMVIDNKTIDVPGIKIGDGNAYLIDLPFVDAAISQQLADHINNTIIHVSANDRAFWNNKLNVLVNGETLELTRQ